MSKPTLLKNYMEDAVADALEEVLAGDAETCRCDRCRLDILALALNSLPPRYVVRDEGYAYAKSSELTIQFHVDLTVAVVKAKNQVAGHPRH